MGKRITNLYSKLDEERTTLEVQSTGVYDIEIVFHTRWITYLRPYSWCYEKTKGLVYCMDLTMELPLRLKYATPRIYLKDLILYLEGYNHRLIKWNRNKDLSNYCLDRELLTSPT